MTARPAGSARCWRAERKAQRGVIWPAFNETDTKIVWSQMIKAPEEDPPYGQWALHTADVNLEAGTLSNNVEWQDPNGQEAFYEVYGWVPHSNQLIFMSNTRATSTGMAAAQLWTLPEELNPATAPTRISPPFAPVWPWQSAVDVYHEFAHFAPGDPNTLYTSIGADTVGGDDLFSYDLRTQQPGGLLGQPRRISYFGGDLNANWGSAAVPGWPFPSYTVVTTMAWVGGGWTITTCPDILCEHVNAWRIQELHTEPASPGGGSEGKSPPPGLRHHRPVRPLAKAPACARSAGHHAKGGRAKAPRERQAASRGHTHKPARKHRRGSGGRALSHSCSRRLLGAPSLPQPCPSQGSREPSPGLLEAFAGTSSKRRRGARGAFRQRPEAAVGSAARYARDPPAGVPDREAVDRPRRRWRATCAEVGGESWLQRRLEEGERAPEPRRAAGRVRRPGLLPQLGAGAQPERHEGAHRPARVLRQHPALGPRQRARARQLLVRAAQRQPHLHPRARPPPRRVGLQPGEPALRAPDRHRLPRAAGAGAGARAGALDRRAARGVPARARPRSWGSTRRASPSTSRRRSPRRCGAWPRPACPPTSSGPPTPAPCAT